MARRLYERKGRSAGQGRHCGQDGSSRRPSGNRDLVVCLYNTHEPLAMAEKEVGNRTGIDLGEFGYLLYLYQISTTLCEFSKSMVS